MRVRAGALGLVLVSMLGIVTPHPAGAAARCADASRCGELKVTVQDFDTAYTLPVSVFAADDPERVVWSESVDPEGSMVAPLPPGRYKVLARRTGWVGGASHASARVITVEAGRTRRVTIGRSAPVFRDVAVRDRRQDAVPHALLVVRDAKDPTQVVNIFRADVGEYQLHLEAGHPYLLDVVDATRRYTTTRRVLPSGISSIHAPVARRAGPETELPRPTGSGTVRGHISVDDYRYTSVNARLYRADQFTTVQDSSPVGDPEHAINVSLKSVLAGTYKVQLTDGLWIGGTSHATADSIVVKPGDTTVITGHVPRRGDLVGDVRSDRGVVLDNVLVSLYRKGTSEPIAYQVTSHDSSTESSYRFVGLPEGEYQIGVTEPTGRIVSRWYGGGNTRTSAQTIRPTLGQETRLRDIQVATGLRATTGPTMTGKRAVGRVLRASTNQWSLPRVAVTRQWLRDGRAIRGATRTSYRLTKADRGHRMSIRVRAKVEGRPAATVTSGSTMRVR